MSGNGVPDSLDFSALHSYNKSISNISERNETHAIRDFDRNSGGTGAAGASPVPVPEKRRFGGADRPAAAAAGTASAHRTAGTAGTDAGGTEQHGGHARPPSAAGGRESDPASDADPAGDDAAAPAVRTASAIAGTESGTAAGTAAQQCADAAERDAGGTEYQRPCGTGASSCRRSWKRRDSSSSRPCRRWCRVCGHSSSSSRPV